MLEVLREDAVEAEAAAAAERGERARTDRLIIDAELELVASDDLRHVVGEIPYAGALGERVVAAAAGLRPDGGESGDAERGDAAFDRRVERAADDGIERQRRVLAQCNARPTEAEFVDQRRAEGAGVAVADTLRIGGAVHRRLGGRGQGSAGVERAPGDREAQEHAVLGRHLDVAAHRRVLAGLEQRGIVEIVIHGLGKIGQRIAVENVLAGGVQQTGRNRVAGERSADVTAAAGIGRGGEGVVDGCRSEVPGPLGGRRDGGDIGLLAADVNALIGAEQPGPVLHDRPAQRSAKLILHQLRLVAGGGEIVGGVERVVA